MDDVLLKGLMTDPEVKVFSPIIDRKVRLKDGMIVRLLGVDPFLDRAIRPDLAPSRVVAGRRGIDEGVLSFLLKERAVFIDAPLAEKLGLGAGDEIETSHGALLVVGTFANPSGAPLIFMDIAHAQGLFGLEGKVDHVDLLLKDARLFRSRWAKGLQIQSGSQLKANLSDMLKAFRFNLEALSLLALFVGVFLIYNTAMFGVLSRRKDAGILRSLGAKRLELVAAFLSEILLLGVLGGALGSVLGYFLSRLLTDLLGGTISNLYFFLRPVPIAWSWWIIFLGLVLGCGASLLGVMFPLKELVRMDPVLALQGRVAERKGLLRARRTALVGLMILGISLILLMVSSLHVYVGFAGAFFLLLGATLLTGLCLATLGPGLKWFLQKIGGLPGKVAAGNIRQNLGRTAVAVAAFMVALSMSIGLGSMIGSFRSSLIWWMNTQLRGDLYIAVPSEIEVPEDFYHEIRSISGLGGVYPHRHVQILYQETPVYIRAIDAVVFKKYTRFGWLDGGDEKWDLVKKGSILISESFYRRFRVWSDDTITIEGVRGPARLKVAAVFYDYTTEHGLIMMDRSTYLDLFGDHTIDGLGIFVDAETPGRHQLLEEVRRKAQSRGLPVYTRKQLHGDILAVFDATFAVTRSMRVLAVIVAFFGIAGALLTLFMERRREFGIYRSLGFSTQQVAGMTLMEGLGMGLVSLIISTFVGTAIAYVLIRVINLQSFHWSIFYRPEAGPYLIAAITAILGSIGAAAYPIWKVCRTYPQIQIREE
jgi:putative ABC transport system permease protein